MITVAAQHSAIVLIYLFYVVIIAKALTLPASTQIAVLSTTLLMCGVASMLQARFGSGLLVLFIPSPIYIPVIIAAGLSYGASGIATLLLAAGLVQAVFGSVVRKLRVLFPPEVCGVVVIMLGVSLLPGTLRALVTATADPAVFRIDYVGLTIGMATLAVISASSVWLSGNARLYSLFFGCIVGVILSYFTGHLTTARETFDIGGMMSESLISWHLEQQAQVSAAAFFALPGLSWPGFVLDPGLIYIAAITALVSVVDEIGVLVGTERLDDLDWRKPNFDRLSRGMQISGLVTAISGVIGGMALCMSSANLSLAYATGVTSRAVAITAGAMLTALAFMPFILGIVLQMPDAVLAGLLFYAAAYFIVSGAELALSRMMSPRRALVIGLSVGVGIILQAIPALSHQAAGTALEHVLTPMTFATIIAISLNLVMRIGITQSDTVKIQKGDNGEKVTEALERLGESWGLHRATVLRAGTASNEIIDVFTAMADDNVKCKIEHNELYLFMTFIYEGGVLVIPEKAPTAEDLLNEPDGVSQMSGWIIKKLCDQASVASKGPVQAVRLAFEC